MESAGSGATWSGPIALTGAATVGAGTGDSLTLGGVISGTPGVTFDGETGTTITLSANNTYSGATDITRGTVDIDGSQPQSDVTVSHATLGGDGTVGTVTVTFGEIVGGDAPGVLTTSGLSMDSGSVFMVDLDGATAGSGYSQIKSTGAISLGDAVLGFEGSYTPKAGNSFTILINKSGSTVAGTFATLAEGATTTVDGQKLTITYLGNGEDDIVLSDPAASVPVPATGAVSWPSALAGGVLLLLGLSLVVGARRRRPATA